jgi:hypothetical protein
MDFSRSVCSWHGARIGADRLHLGQPLGDGLGALRRHLEEEHESEGGRHTDAKQDE